MRLIINEPGTFIGIKKGIIVVKKKDGEKLEIAAPKINMITILTRGATISSALLRVLAKQKISLIVYSSFGIPITHLVNYTYTRTKLKKEQYKAQENEKSVHLAKSFAIGKILNQKEILYSMAKNRKKSNPKLADFLFEISNSLLKYSENIKKIESKNVESVRMNIINEEAEAAEKYWLAIKEAFKDFIDFPGRKKRFDRPTDPINISLNYLYSILAGECLICLDSIGLDPYAGFLHVDSPRRPALVMDLIEEFRQPIVDRIVFKMVYEKKLDNIIENSKLKREARLILYRKFCERLNEIVTFNNRSLPISEHIFLQAKRIADYIMYGEIYTPFVK
ncbi:MAG: CRISPR-associated endonuclease Cas1 [Candidatus Aenigmatarchaeota archaeon]